MSWKTIFQWAAAGLVTMYAIRYLRASNSMIASLYPQGQPLTSVAAARTPSA